MVDAIQYYAPTATFTFSIQDAKNMLTNISFVLYSFFL